MVIVVEPLYVMLPLKLKSPAWLTMVALALNVFPAVHVLVVFPVFVNVPAPLKIAPFSKTFGDWKLTVPLKVVLPLAVVVVDPPVEILTFTLAPKVVPLIVVPPAVVFAIDTVFAEPEFVIVPPVKVLVTPFPLMVIERPFKSRFPENVRRAIVTLISNVQTVAPLIVTFDVEMGTPPVQLAALLHK